MRRRILLALAGVTLCACGQQPSKASVDSPGRVPVQLDARTCQPVTAAQKRWLSGEFADFERYAITCPVRTGPDVIALYVVSLDAYALENALPAGAAAPRLPKARLVLPDGSLAGALPFAYPFDPPVTLEVTFADWVADWPRTVELFLEDPAVGGNRKLPPLKWDDKLRKYTESKTSNGS